jgi:peptide chain release factor 2
MRERARLSEQVEAVRAIENAYSENCELAELGEEEEDEQTIRDAHAELAALKGKVERMQIRALLSDDVDGNDAYLEVNSGAGGTEACDWAQMLLRMYMRWAENAGYSVTVMDRTEGDEAGIKSATLRIEGDMAYGWLKTETGVHRLVRISPFDSSGRRHTSFASVAVTPVIDDTIEVEIEDKDLRVDTFRSSGAGGQHVNTTDSAVRITHHPSGIVVACQSERSQHQNREHAMNMLRARLYEMERQRRAEEQERAHDQKAEIGWGNQIRSYVLHPYQMIKDLRTRLEDNNTRDVLDGKIDHFLEAALAARLDSDSDESI